MICRVFSVLMLLILISSLTSTIAFATVKGQVTKVYCYVDDLLYCTVTHTIDSAHVKPLDKLRQCLKLTLMERIKEKLGEEKTCEEAETTTKTEFTIRCYALDYANQHGAISRTEQVLTTAAISCLSDNPT